jgi:Fe-S cluster assembly protein SufD
MSTQNTTTGTDLHRLIDEAHPITHAARPDDSWLAAIREQGRADALSLPLPHRKQEAWRYTPTSFLDKIHYRALIDGPFDALQLSDIDDLLLPGRAGPRLVFVNGYLAPRLSELPQNQHAIALSSVSGGLGPVRQALRWRLGDSAEHENVFTALNSALMTDGALIRIAGDCLAESPIEILHVTVNTEEPGICHPRHLVVVEDGGNAEIIERYCSLGPGGVFTNAKIDVSLGANSKLRHQRLMEEGREARHLSDLQVRLAERSDYVLNQIALGCGWSRSDVRVTFEGEEANAELDGLLLARDGQVNDVHLDVRHAVPHCTSRETFKGILDGKGKVIFDGRILVAQDAQKTDARLSNDNLMLSRSAEVDSKPQLEIFADDVKCSHGTTVGELDSDAIFYLRSRGISQERAVQMLCRGFAQEIIERIPDQHVRARAGRLLEQRLSKTGVSSDETPDRGGYAD